MSAPSELMDLRLHRPQPDVVIVRVSGTVGSTTAPTLIELIGKQLTRASHVIIDLGNTGVLSPEGLMVLRVLYQQAMAREGQLHVVGARSDAIRHFLKATAPGHVLPHDATADTVIAGLPPQVTSEITRQPQQVAGRPGCGRAPPYRPPAVTSSGCVCHHRRSRFPGPGRREDHSGPEGRDDG